jgi:hypothetical protein
MTQNESPAPICVLCRGELKEPALGMPVPAKFHGARWTSLIWSDMQTWNAVMKALSRLHTTFWGNKAPADHPNEYTRCVRELLEAYDAWLD